jgi:hypothetical protein
MTPGAQLTTLAVLAVGVSALGVRLIMSLVHRSPEKRERKRRLAVNAMGRLGDALITEVADSTIYYSYSISGVQYEASQDISALLEKLPAEPERLVGVANLKYSPRNPANSILVCEEWSGLRRPREVKEAQSA